MSIVITNHDYGRYLPAAIDSALGQTYGRCEVIVVDDGSTDDSREVIARYGRRLGAILQLRGGQGAAYNAGLAASRGEILCLLDADDAFVPTKVERIVDAFGRNPAAGWVRHKLALTDELLRPTGSSIPRFAGSALNSVDPRVALEHKVRFVVSSGIALRRSMAMRVLPIPRSEVEQWQIGADAYLGTLSAAAAPCYSLDESLAYYRQHRRLTSADATSRFLELNIRFDRQLSAVLSKRMGRKVMASDVFKHSLALDALRGSSLLSRQRLESLAAGLVTLVPVFRLAPSLAVRQGAGLLLAFLAPGLWLKRVTVPLGFGD